MRQERKWFGRVSRSAVVFASGITLLALGVGFYVGSKRSHLTQVPKKRLLFAEAGQPIGGVLHLARYRSLFHKHGLDIKFSPYSTGKEALQAVLSGEADLATVADTPVVLAALNRKKLKIIATIGTTTKGVGIVAPARTVPIPARLRGETIGYTPNTNSEYFLEAFLIKYGIDKASVSTKAYEAHDIVPAYISGEVGAVSTWSPQIAKIHESNFKSNVFYGRGIYTWYWNIVVREDVLKKNAESLKSLLKALVEGEALLAQEPEIGKRAVEKYSRLPPSQLEIGWDSMNFEVALDQSLLVNLEYQARLFSERYRAKSMNFLNILAPDSLSAVQKTRVNLISWEAE